MKTLTVFKVITPLLVAFVAWYFAWYNRRRIEARIIRETYDLQEFPFSKVTLVLEVTNVGDKISALNREIIVKTAAEKDETSEFTLVLNEENRELPPHTPKIFTATGKFQIVYLFSWFRRYRLSTTKGRGISIHVKHASNQKIGVVEYWRGYCMLTWLGKLPK